MQAIAKNYVYWPSLDDDITSYVKDCKHCATVAKSPMHSAPIPWPKPVGPWKRIHVDFAGPIEADYFLLAVDAFSKWPEVIRTRRITSAATIAILRNIFARFGMPETLVSDNGTQFTSVEFQNFCVGNGIQHISTAPFHPQSNGQVERFVDTFKRAVRKISEGKSWSNIDEALEIFLLTYRTTPNRQVQSDMSPAEVAIFELI
ncbi:uncharacterized protein K02A2.6-like [Wyeomyia smithii]|uniref:uncharacterized protein K02A2.6-like n=1 Tax=Wyeomyia smithii TaxID=174621 RepID=UPI00246816FD|nr:uncharacterized protein K02A2.6-like [Wyeomyia smithii]